MNVTGLAGFLLAKSAAARFGDELAGVRTSLDDLRANFADAVVAVETFHDYLGPE